MVISYVNGERREIIYEYKQKRFELGPFDVRVYTATWKNLSEADAQLRAALNFEKLKFT